MIELLVVVVLIGVAAAIAVPSLSTFIAKQRTASANSDFHRAINTARSEAIRRNRPVTLAAARCGGSFESGWVVFVDNAATDQCRTANEELILERGALHGDIVVRWANGDRNRHYLVFGPTGAVQLANGSSALSQATFLSNSAGQQISLCLNSWGRTRVLKGAASCISEQTEFAPL